MVAHKWNEGEDEEAPLPTMKSSSLEDGPWIQFGICRISSKQDFEFHLLPVNVNRHPAVLKEEVLVLEQP